MTATVQLPVELLVVDPTNPRPDPGTVDELATSIAADGILSPLIVRQFPDGRYGVLCGQRRLTAARRVGLTAVPATVIDVDDRQAAIVGLAENLHRSSLDPISEARAYRRMLDQQPGLTQLELADRLGVSQPRIAQRLRLLQLPGPLQAAVAAGEVSIMSAYKQAKTTRGPLDRPRKRKTRDADPLDLLDLNPKLTAAVRTAAATTGTSLSQWIAKACSDQLRRTYRSRP